MKKKSTSGERPRPGKPALNFPLLCVVAAFAVSRILYWLAGVRFDTYANVHLMHFIPADLLRSRLWETVFHLHDQPPLFNLFLGAVYSLFPGFAPQAFHAVFLALGLALAVSMHCVMTRLGVSPRFSAALTILFTISPACVLFENLLMYSYPVTALIGGAALFLLRFLEKGRFRDAAIFFSLLASVALMRSMYHLLWFLLFPALLIVFRRRQWKPVLLAAALPFLAVFFLYAKNLYLFGSFNGSSWMGMSLSKLTSMRLSEDERIDLIRQGKLSELSLLPPFKALWFYSQYSDIPKFRKTGVPVLDLEFFPDIGNNWNNAAYLAISDQYRKDALTVMKTRPGVYLKGVGESFIRFFFPSSDWFHIYASADNAGKITPVERFFDTALYGQFFGAIVPGLTADVDQSYFSVPGHMGFFILLGFLLACGWGAWFVFGRLRGGHSGDPATLAVMYMLICIFYTALVGNMLEVGENYRFRFDVDPLVLILFGMFASDVARRLRHPEKPRGHPANGVTRRVK